MPSPVINKHFNAPDADIHIVSSDNVLFKIHLKNLTAHSRAFPEQLYSDGSSAAIFEESSEVLDHLFGFIYLNGDLVPTLLDVPFDIVKAIGIAAHKYAMPFGIAICQLRMVAFAESGKADVLFPAFDYLVHFHGMEKSFLSKMDNLALLTIVAKVNDVKVLMQGACFKAWVLYRAEWKDHFDNVKGSKQAIVFGPTWAAEYTEKCRLKEKAADEFAADPIIHLRAFGPVDISDLIDDGFLRRKPKIVIPTFSSCLAQARE